MLGVDMVNGVLTRAEAARNGMSAAFFDGCNVDDETTAASPTAAVVVTPPPSPGLGSLVKSLMGEMGAEGTGKHQ
jgi:hypothetical protein